MCLGALVSAVVPLAYLQAQIALLNLPERVELTAKIVRKNGIAATKVDVILPHESSAHEPHPPARHLKDIEAILTRADLPDRAIAWSLAIFRRLAQAEGAIHGIDPEKVHFHEVGATDAIVDIVGTCLGLDWLGIDEIHCAPLPTGRGSVRAAHGRLPVPAPAVLKLMEMAAVPIYNAGLTGELVTPTGAAIATELATHFGDPPPMQLRKVGLGAGNKDLPLPNILRLWIGQSTGTAEQWKTSTAQSSQTIAPHYHASASVSSGLAIAPLSESPSPSSLPISPTLDAASSIEDRAGRETVVVLETQVDDLSPQAIGYLYDRLFAAGALDVFVQPAMMKKSRPGHLLVAIAYPEQVSACETLLLQETTTLGVRQTQQTRLRLRRQIVPIQTPLGTIRMKVAYLPHSDRPLKAHPEYEDCAALAKQHALPWREVHNQALAQWQQQSVTP